MLCLLRLSPITPYNVFNYFCGITSVRMRDFLISMICMTPPLGICVYWGTSLESLVQIFNGESSNESLIILISGLIITVLVVVGVTILV